MLTAHPYANLFPMISGPDLDEFTKSIKEQGVQNSIVMFDGQILDGRNRYAAAQKVGVECPSVEYTGNDPLGFVIASNLHRRHLTTHQRAAIAAELANLSHGSNQHRQKEEGSNDPSSAVTIDEAAKALGVSPKSVKRAKATMKADPAAHEAAKAGITPKGTKPQKSKQLPVPKKDDDQEEEEMRFDTGLILVMTGLSTCTSSSSLATARKELADHFELGDLDTKEKYLANAIKLAAEKKCKDRFREASKIKEEIEKLSKTGQMTVKHAILASIKQHEVEFDRRVREAADAKIPERIAMYEELQAKADAAQMRFYAMSSGISAHITKNEHRVLLSFFHSDHQPTDEQKNKAFHIVQKIGEYLKAVA